MADQLSIALAYITTIRIGGAVSFSRSNNKSVARAEPRADSDPDTHTNRATPNEPAKRDVETNGHTCANAFANFDR